MVKNYNSYSFSDYPPTEILGTDAYKSSIKQLSFQYRAKDDDKLIAFILLSKEQIPTNVTEIDNHLTGCRILGLYVVPIFVDEYEVDNVTLRVALLDEAEHYINGWVDTNNHNKYMFDYFWFYNTDVKKKEIIDEIGQMTTVGDISFKMVKHYSGTSTP